MREIRKIVLRPLAPPAGTGVRLTSPARRGCGEAVVGIQYGPARGGQPVREVGRARPARARDCPYEYQFVFPGDFHFN